jgi:hypothetical protein
MNREFFSFIWRVTACHTLSYFLFGLAAATLFHYRDWFQSEAMAGYMVSMDAPRVAAGPALQVFRGLLFGLVLWPVRTAFLHHPRGWLHLWLLFIGLAILGTAGPAPGSIEGWIYTRLPHNFAGLFEVFSQTLAFSLLLTRWYRHPGRWWNRLMIPAFALIIFMSLMGFVVAMGWLRVPPGSYRGP